MSCFKEFILECDFFAHGTFQRYKDQESYRTLVGGIVSVILVILFIIVFANLAIQTFTQSIIFSTIATEYANDPTYSELNLNPSNNFMFAIGLTGIDLSSSVRYFDILLTAKSTIVSGGVTTKTSLNIPLAPCNLSQWSGVSDPITNAYTNLGFSQWLCPPTGQVLPMQGKFTSQTFIYSQIVVSKCTNNTHYPGTTCQSSTAINSFLSSNGEFTFNFYFINPVLNPGDPTPISYYLQDSNYFAFDTYTGMSANLFYSDYSITTDTSILPLNDFSEIDGQYTQQTAVGQSYQIQNTTNQYFKFYLRKGASSTEMARSFQKIDQTLSYIGGLFGTIVLLLIFLTIYSKYCYELDLGDRVFKENNNGSFGSENFNFVVFMGYLIFIFFSKFGVILNWKVMKRYHRCRMECQKQLNIDLLFKKVTHFQQVTKVLLQQHQLQMLLMVPKPTIKEAKLNRKKFLVKTIIYHQLQRKGRDIYIQKQQFKNRLQQFLRDQSGRTLHEVMQENELCDASLKAIQQDMVSSYKKLQKEKENHHVISSKIFERIQFDEIKDALLSFVKPEEEGSGNLKVGERTDEGLIQMQVRPFPLLEVIEMRQFEFLENKEHESYNQLNISHKSST